MVRSWICFPEKVVGSFPKGSPNSGAHLGLSRRVHKGPFSPGSDGGYLILGGCTAPKVGLSGNPPLTYLLSIHKPCPWFGQGRSNKECSEVHGALRSQSPTMPFTTYSFPGISLGKGPPETCHCLFLMPLVFVLMNVLQLNNQHVP